MKNKTETRVDNTVTYINKGNRIVKQQECYDCNSVFWFLADEEGDIYGEGLPNGE